MVARRPVENFLEKSFIKKSRKPQARVRFSATALVIVAKNSRLKKQIYKAIKKENISDKIIEVRGEDVPFLTESVIRKGKNAVGITGEDLFREYQLKNYNSKLQVLKRIEWKDKKAIFGKPTLCLFGPSNSSLDEMPKKLRVCINNRYKKIAKRYLNDLEKNGYVFEKIYVSGSSEKVFAAGAADLIMDIIYSGKSAKSAGLAIYDKIFSSDVVVIGKK